MSERDLAREVARGQRARSELTETEFAFDAVRAALVKTLAETPIGADAKILKLHMSLQNLSAVRDALVSTINNGAHASATMAARDAIAGAGLTRP